MFAMQPVIYKFAGVCSFTLSDLIFMMGEHIVDPAGMQIKSFTQIFLTHGTAFNVPSGSAGAPGAVPFHIAVFFVPCFPECKVTHGIFFIFIGTDPHTVPLLFPVDFCELTVFFKFINGKIYGPIFRFIGISFFEKSFDHFDHFGNVGSGFGINVCLFDS